MSKLIVNQLPATDMIRLTSSTALANTSTPLRLKKPCSPEKLSGEIVSSQKKNSSNSLNSTTESFDLGYNVSIMYHFNHTVF